MSSRHAAWPYLHASPAQCALIWLVGERDVIAKARQMDHVFWQYGDLVRRGDTIDADTWRAARDAMETARVEFINAARRSIVRSGGTVEDAPVARTPPSNVDTPSSSELDAAAWNGTGD
jgi:hypothetical protein